MPNTGTKLGKGEKTPKGYTEVGTFTTNTHRKENINQVMLSKVWYLAYMQNHPRTSSVLF